MTDEQIQELERKIEDLKKQKQEEQTYYEGKVIGKGSGGDLAVNIDGKNPITFLQDGDYAPVGARVRVKITRKKEKVWFGALEEQLTESGLSKKEIVEQLQDQFNIPDRQVVYADGQKQRFNKSGLLKILSSVKPTQKNGDY